MVWLGRRPHRESCVSLDVLQGACRAFISLHGWGPCGRNSSASLCNLRTCLSFWQRPGEACTLGFSENVGEAGGGKCRSAELDDKTQFQAVVSGSAGWYYYRSWTMGANCPHMRRMNEAWRSKLHAGKRRTRLASLQTTQGPMFADMPDKSPQAPSAGMEEPRVGTADECRREEKVDT